ncbi:hypothetical protein STEG23_029024 [Scotinomys teguina]
MCRPSWFLDPGGWRQTTAFGLHLISPGLCTLSLGKLSSIAPASSPDASDSKERFCSQTLGSVSPAFTSPEPAILFCTGPALLSLHYHSPPSPPQQSLMCSPQARGHELERLVWTTSRPGHRNLQLQVTKYPPNNNDNNNNNNNNNNGNNNKTVICN